MTFALNITTGEYIEYSSKNIKDLVNRLTETFALTLDDIGESRWKRTDHIVFVPEHLENYVKRQYIQIM
jgi:hypothetical protein